MTPGTWATMLTDLVNDPNLQSAAPASPAAAPDSPPQAAATAV